MNGLCAREDMGCLFIGEPSDGWDGGGRSRPVNIPGIELRPFRCSDGGKLWEQLQNALCEIREEWGICAVMAAGVGCAAALALACQLPVERLVLIDPELPARRKSPRPAGEGDHEKARMLRTSRRLAAFVRRNLPLCVSDLLVVEHDRGNRGEPLRRTYGTPVNCRVKRLLILGESDKELYTIREIAVKQAISRFLHPIEASKPLAENPEMCIIYG